MFVRASGCVQNHAIVKSDETFTSCSSFFFFKAPYTTPGEIATAGGMESIAANGIPEMSATPPHFALALGDNFYVSDVKNATNNKTLT